MTDRIAALAEVLLAAIPGYSRWFEWPVTTGREARARSEAREAEAYNHAAAILAALPEWMLVRKDESIWAALEADPLFRSSMAAAEAGIEAGRTTKYELVPNAEIARLRTDAERGCWIWPRGKNAEGYGTLHRDGRSLMAHRASFEAFWGPIPEGMTLDHLCRNPSCVRPDHLEAVSERENILRGTSGSAANARKTECPQGHPYDFKNTYLWRGKRSCKTCQRARVKRLRADGRRAPGDGSQQRRKSILARALEDVE